MSELQERDSLIEELKESLQNSDQKIEELLEKKSDKDDNSDDESADEKHETVDASELKLTSQIASMTEKHEEEIEALLKQKEDEIN